MGWLRFSPGSASAPKNNNSASFSILVLLLLISSLLAFLSWFSSVQFVRGQQGPGPYGAYGPGRRPDPAYNQSRIDELAPFLAYNFTRRPASLSNGLLAYWSFEEGQGDFAYDYKNPNYYLKINSSWAYWLMDTQYTTGIHILPLADRDYDSWLIKPNWIEQVLYNDYTGPGSIMEVLNNTNQMAVEMWVREDDFPYYEGEHVPYVFIGKFGSNTYFCDPLRGKTWSDFPHNGISMGRIVYNFYDLQTRQRNLYGTVFQAINGEGMTVPCDWWTWGQYFFKISKTNPKWYWSGLQHYVFSFGPGPSSDQSPWAYHGLAGNNYFGVIRDTLTGEQDIDNLSYGHNNVTKFVIPQGSRFSFGRPLMSRYPGVLQRFSGDLYLLALWNRPMTIFEARETYWAGLPNQPPFARPVNVTTLEDTPVNVTFDARDLENRTIWINVTTPPSKYAQGYFRYLNGTEIMPNQWILEKTVQFVPAPNFHTGNGSSPLVLQYYASERADGADQIYDGGPIKVSRTTTLTITVTPVIDPPITHDIFVSVSDLVREITIHVNGSNPVEDPLNQGRSFSACTIDDFSGHGSLSQFSDSDSDDNNNNNNNAAITSFPANLTDVPSALPRVVYKPNWMAGEVSYNASFSALLYDEGVPSDAPGHITIAVHNPLGIAAGSASLEYANNERLPVHVQYSDSSSTMSGNTQCLVFNNAAGVDGYFFESQEAGGAGGAGGADITSAVKSQEPVLCSVNPQQLSFYFVPAAAYGTTSSYGCFELSLQLHTITPSNVTARSPSNTTRVCWNFTFPAPVTSDAAFTVSDLEADIAIAISGSNPTYPLANRNFTDAIILSITGPGSVSQYSDTTPIPPSALPQSVTDKPGMRFRYQPSYTDKLSSYEAVISVAVVDGQTQSSDPGHIYVSVTVPIAVVVEPEVSFNFTQYTPQAIQVGWVDTSSTSAQNSHCIFLNNPASVIIAGGIYFFDETGVNITSHLLQQSTSGSASEAQQPLACNVSTIWFAPAAAQLAEESEEECVELELFLGVTTPSSVEAYSPIQSMDVCYNYTAPPPSSDLNDNSGNGNGNSASYLDGYSDVEGFNFGANTNNSASSMIVFDRLTAVAAAALVALSILALATN